MLAATLFMRPSAAYAPYSHMAGVVAQSHFITGHFFAAALFAGEPVALAFHRLIIHDAIPGIAIYQLHDGNATPYVNRQAFFASQRSIVATAHAASLACRQTPPTSLLFIEPSHYAIPYLILHFMLIARHFHASLRFVSFHASHTCATS